jgi:hypothetical protein
MAISIEVDFKGYWRERDVAGINAGSGIYCVYECTYNPNNDTVSIHKLIYIGESSNVRDRILGHEKLRDWKKYVRPGNELCFSFGAVPEINRVRAEAAMINHHKPPVNKECKYDFPYLFTAMSSSGNNRFLNSHFNVG